MDYEIAEFGRRMGFDGLALPRQGPLALEIGDSGELYLERGEDELLVYLAVASPFYDDQLIVRAMTECAFENAPAFQWSCGYYKDRLMLMSRLKNEAVRAVALEKLTMFLLDTYRRITEFGL